MIRRLTRADLGAFRQLWEKGLLQEPTAFLLTHDEARRLSDDAIASGLEAGRHIGAFDGDGGLVGLASLKRGAVTRLAHMADFGPLYVTPAARRQGFARALLQEALAMARDMGVLQVELAVDASNSGAIALYEAMGFARIGLRPRSVIVDGLARDDLLMLWSLD